MRSGPATVRSDLRRAHRVSRIRRVPLEGKPLDLDAQQLKLRDVALLRPEALDPLQLVERLQVLLGQAQRLPADQDVRERLLDLEDGLPLEIGQLITGDPRGRPRAVEPPLAFAAQLDGLADRNRVLCLAGASAAELLREERGLGIRAEAGRDLVGGDRLALELLRAQGRILARRQFHRLVQRDPVDALLRARGLHRQRERDRQTEDDDPAHEPLPLAPARSHWQFGSPPESGGATTIASFSTLLHRPARS